MANGKGTPEVNPGSIVVVGIALVLVGLPIVLLIRTCSAYTS